MCVFDFKHTPSPLDLDRTLDLFDETTKSYFRTIIMYINEPNVRISA